MTDTDDTIAASRATIDRVRGRDLIGVPVPRRKRGDRLAFRIAAIAIVNAIILIGAGVVGFVLPLGIFGALAVLLLMVAATCLIAFAPVQRAPTLEKLRDTPVAALPAQTGRWLNAQRPALPAPALDLVDQIALKLDTLTPQLATLNDAEPAAAEVRKLIGEQLPDFVKGYTAVPPTLRSQPRNGKTPDAQLTDGLTVIDRQLSELSAQLAQGDLDNLSTRGRFLEIKYLGDDDNVTVRN